MARMRMDRHYRLAGALCTLTSKFQFVLNLSTMDPPGVKPPHTDTFTLVGIVRVKAAHCERCHYKMGEHAHDARASRCALSS